MSPDQLREYRRKRDSGKTPEPFESEKKSRSGPIFVVRDTAAGNRVHDAGIEQVLHAKYARGERAAVVSRENRHRPLRDDRTAVVLFIDEMYGDARDAHPRRR